MGDEKRNPIFIHSLFRSGSTYMFEVFRRSPEKYWCYQEPLNEFLLNAKSAPQQLLDMHSNKNMALRHPRLDKPYFWEFYTISGIVGKLFRMEFSYDTFFLADEADQKKLKTYFEALIAASEGQPVFLCTRTFARLGRLKELLGGDHIYLWRNPWDQWWSYKVATYFDATNQMILNAKNLSRLFLQVKDELNFYEVNDADVMHQFKHFEDHPLNSEQSYLLFYLLWSFALLESQESADLLLNIDALSTSKEYREEIKKELARKKGISGLDFKDCKVYQAIYSDDDIAFFQKIENRANALLLGSGYGDRDLDLLTSLRERYLSAEVHTPKKTTSKRVLDDLYRARQLFLRTESRVAIQSQRWLEAENESLRWQKETEKHLGESASAREQAKCLEGELNTARAQIEQLEMRERDAMARVEEAQSRSNQLEAGLQSAKKGITKLEDHAQWLQDEWDAAKEKIDELNSHAHHWRTVAYEFEQQLKAVYVSKSWRMTHPLRVAMNGLRRVKATIALIPHGMKHAVKAIIKALLAPMIRFALARPTLKSRALALVRKYPTLESSLRRLAAARGLTEVDTPISTSQPQVSPVELSHLTPTARRIYADLKAAIAERPKDLS